ncbi:MAG TPA: bifunctional UDP-N-acetylglucosamine diphosphorylase/glucosamine-1-phosphate N-acetyltransferase GlmU [Xanthobacteraceae bacterium]|jgi:bifunctional UDP-N-acetylglucosamine pyrophosphorylase/glucosamine-1-phosphate N-acetyltransferase
MPARTTILILAAGEGTRMKSATPKVLHRIGGASLISHVLAAATAAKPARIAVVIGPGRADVAAEVRRVAPKAGIFVQKARRGTAHAVSMARKAFDRGEDIVVVFGDTPLVRAETLRKLAAALKQAPVAVLGFRAENPHGYGRLIEENGRLVAIREQTDTSPEEQTITLCNAGVMAISGKIARDVLARIGNDNAKREFYLSDAVLVARSLGLAAIVHEASEEEVMGVNDRNQLAEAEALLQARLRVAALKGGATLIAPDTVFLSADTKLGRDVIVEPYVIFGPGCVVEDGANIHAFSHLEGARVGKGASVGPFARLRPGTKLGKQARIGNFVEVKAASIEAGAKANHLAYIGDGRVGADANIGAGTIFCNFDGAKKHFTDVGAGAFVGSNSALVAPVKVGKGAYVASGSVITEDVPANALAVGRGRQVIKRGWAKKSGRAKLKRKVKDTD